MDVPVRGEHGERVRCHPRGYVVICCQAGDGQVVTVLIVAGLYLVAEDAGELDVLGRVVGVHVVEHGQVGDRFHWSALPGEDREDRLAGILRAPSPSGGQGLNDEQTAPVLGAGGRGALDRRKRARVGHHNRHRARAVRQTQQVETE
jgi:hypothetical protein